MYLAEIVNLCDATLERVLKEVKMRIFETESLKTPPPLGMVLVDPEGKEYSHVIRLNFYASEDDMDYEALLAGLVIKGIGTKDATYDPNEE
ncbi:hypothetical protein Tco_0480402 [Tanacetum coccineum]